MTPIQTPRRVPEHLAGKWLAWTPDGLFLLGSGDTPAEARNSADAQGAVPAAGWIPSMNIAYEWVPPANERFIGPMHS